jgi:uncharacterized membrane protein
MNTGQESGTLRDDRSLREFTRQAFVTGVAVTIPLLVTLVVFGFVVNFVSNALNPVVGVVESVVGLSPTDEAVVKMLSLVTILAVVLTIGTVAESRPGKSGLASLFDTAMSRIPGVGSLYRSVDEMSTLLLDSDTQSFQEVKLVEFPVEGSYAIAFLTAETPDVVVDATGHDGEMLTVFLPMAPNPVMGGYVVNVAESRVYDVDMTVEEGIQSIVTSGVATGQRDDLDDGVIERLERSLRFDGKVVDRERLQAYAPTTTPERNPMAIDHGSDVSRSDEDESSDSKTETDQ